MRLPKDDIYYDPIHLGFSQLDVDEFAAAAHTFETLVHNPVYEREPLVFYGFATALFRLQDEQETLSLDTLKPIIEAYKHSLNLDPDFADTHLILGLAYMKKAFFLREMLIRTPNHERLRHAVFHNVGMAEHCFQEAERINPKYLGEAGPVHG